MGMRLTIKGKLIVVNILLFGVLLSGFAVFVYKRTSSYELSQIDAQLEIVASKIITQFEDEWEENMYPEWDELTAMRTNLPFSVTAITLQTPDSRVVMSSDSNYFYEKTIPPSVLSGTTDWKSYERGEQSFRRMVVPVKIEDEVRYVLTITSSLTSVEQRLENLSIILILSVAATLLLAVIIISIIIRMTFKPIVQMVETAESITGDTLYRRIPLSGRTDEVSRLGQALNSMMDRIEKAFESQKRFVSEASHELRTPLTIIIGELEYIEKQINEVTLKQNISLALGELDRLAKLVEMLLTLTRIDAGRLPLHKQEIRFDELVLESVGFLNNLALEKGVTFDPQLTEEVVLNGDPVHLKRAVINVLDNAIKYADRDSLITIALEKSGEHTAQLSISNFGEGVPEEEREKIFNRFYRSPRVRPNASGSGLGLSITRKLVELHDGRILLKESADGVTTFTIYLPMK